MSDERREELASLMVTVLPRWGSWIASIRDFETPYGKLGFRQLAILFAVRHNLIPPEELSPTSLARQQRVRPSVITRALTRLEEGGFIERAMDLQDRRRIILTLTDKGRDASILVEQMFYRDITANMEHLDNETISKMIDVIGLLEDVIERLEANGHDLYSTDDDPVNDL